MLDSIRKLFTGDTAQTGDSEAALHLAAAILLIEVAKSDRAIDDEEIVRLRETLKRDWQLNEADLDGLMDVAQDASDTKLSLNQHIDLINRNFSAARKLDLFRSLWQAACADGDIHHREEVFIQRLADLLEVPQDELIRARKWALDSEKGNDFVTDKLVVASLALDQVFHTPLDHRQRAESPTVEGLSNTAIDLDYLRAQIVGVDTLVETPFGQRLMLYADYTASGRSLHFVEDYLLRQQQLYANSHTEDDISGRATTELLHEAEDHIKQAVNAGPDGRIITCGTGATGAIDRMQQLVGVKLPATGRALLKGLLQGFLGDQQAAEFERYCRQHQPVVFVGPYEHHSNEVSWRESLVTVVEVALADDGGIDLHHLETLLQEPAYQGRLRIGSFSAASNVTGMRSPIYELARLLHKYDALAFFDYAASAPYVPIDMNPSPDQEGVGAFLDAVFISPHKFLGGPGSSGLLIFNKRCYHPELPPSIAGGGTVDYVGPADHDFIHDVEAREKAGTPGILQTLRAALAFEVKAAVGIAHIEQREAGMIRQALARWGANPRIEILGNPDPERRVGIVSFNVRDPKDQYLHPRFVTTLLNDLFGIQSRAGCSCAGPYGHQLLGIDEQRAAQYRSWITRGYHGVKPGWCRVGFHYVFDTAEVGYLLDCVDFVAAHGHRFVRQYHFDARSGAWRHKQWQQRSVSFSLSEALQSDRIQPQALTAAVRRQRYQAYLAQARELAERLA